MACGCSGGDVCLDDRCASPCRCGGSAWLFGAFCVCDRLDTRFPTRTPRRFASPHRPVHLQLLRTSRWPERSDHHGSARDAQRLPEGTRLRTLAAHHRPSAARTLRRACLLRRINPGSPESPRTSRPILDRLLASPGGRHFRDRVLARRWRTAHGSPPPATRLRPVGARLMGACGAPRKLGAQTPSPYLLRRSRSSDSAMTGVVARGTPPIHDQRNTSAPVEDVDVPFARNSTTVSAATAASPQARNRTRTRRIATTAKA
jgi:hypothetical protein